MASYEEHPTQRVRAFASSGALCLEVSNTADSTSVADATLNLKLAAKRKSGEQPDWNAGIYVRMRSGEMSRLAAVLLGYAPGDEFKRPKKGISIERQQGKLYLRATEQGKATISIPVGVDDAFRLSMLTLSRLQEASGGLDSTLLIASIRGSAALLRQGPGHSSRSAP